MGLISYFSYLLLLNTMLPISLIVSLEFVKLFQSFFMCEDLDLLKNEHKMSMNTCSINEELGMVEYIFSDKTGTLTCNKMEFKHCVVGTKVYGNTQPSEDPLFSFQDSNLVETLKDVVPSDKLHLSSSRPQNYDFSENDLLYEFFMVLCAAHECIIDQEEKKSYIVYQGMSPDEITLVDAASRLGFQYLGRQQNTILLNIQGKERKIELLYLFSFDSDRKRMTVIVKDDGVIKLYCKVPNSFILQGADSIIIKRLSQKIKQPFLINMVKKLEEFSLIGLRTLCMSIRILSDYEF